jgi:hypothetical protein
VEVVAIAGLWAGLGVRALLTLTVVGRVELDPPHPLDAAVAAAFDAHQRRTVAGRRQLGPDAVGVAVRAFIASGAAVDVRPSPWLLSSSTDADLVDAWLRGWVGAASERRPDLALEDYLADRLATARAGRLRLTVHHADLLARWPEAVAEQDDVGDRSELDQLGAPGGGGEPSRSGEARPARGAEEERRHDEVQLVDEPRREEGRVDGSPALDEQLPHAAPREVAEQAGEQVGEPGGTSGVDDVGERAEPAPQLADDRSRGEHEPLGVPGGEERRGGIEVAGPGEGDLGGARGQTPRSPGVATRGRPHEQPRVVGTDGARPDEDRIGRGAYGVDPVEVRRRGENQPAWRGVVEIAVDRRRAAQHDQGPFLFAQSDHTATRFREEGSGAARWHRRAIALGRVVPRSIHRS